MPAKRFWNLRIERRTLARLLCVLFALSLLPLLMISVYNYPADDDFGFVLPVATAWVSSGSLARVAEAVWAKLSDTWLNWQGAFASTAYISFSPMIFNMRLYFLCNIGILALLCLSVGYMLKGVLVSLLHTDGPAFAICYVCLMSLMLQFMPDIGEGIYWHTGTVYTITAVFLFLLLGLLARAEVQPGSRARQLWRAIALSLCAVMVGGGSYGPMLGALVFVCLLTVWAFARHSKARYAYLLTLVVMLAAAAVSVLAPGNAVRQQRMGDSLSPFSTIITTVLDSFDLAGSWLSPQLLAALLLVLPVMYTPLKESRFSFRHPLWVFVALYGLFSASMAPGIYTRAGYGAGRYMNVLYFYFLLMAFGSALYAEGALIRKWQTKQAASPACDHLLCAAQTAGKRFTAGYLAFALALLTLGAFENTLMNTSSISAAKSLLTGEAQYFHREMLKRQEYIRVTDSDEVAVQPLSRQPYVFKQDRLPWQGIYGRVRYMKWYYELFYEAEHPAE